MSGRDIPGPLDDDARCLVEVLRRTAAFGATLVVSLHARDRQSVNCDLPCIPSTTRGGGAGTRPVCRPVRGPEPARHPGAPIIADVMPVLLCRALGYDP